MVVKHFHHLWSFEDKVYKPMRQKKKNGNDALRLLCSLVLDEMRILRNQGSVKTKAILLQSSAKILFADIHRAQQTTRQTQGVNWTYITRSENVQDLFWQIFTRALESLKIGILMGSFHPKLKKYDLKIHRRVICHGNEEWRKIWREIDFFQCHFKVDMRNFTNFDQWTWKSQVFSF